MNLTKSLSIQFQILRVKGPLYEVRSSGKPIMPSRRLVPATMTHSCVVDKYANTFPYRVGCTTRPYFLKRCAVVYHQ